MLIGQNLSMASDLIAHLLRLKILGRIFFENMDSLLRLDLVASVG